MRDSPALGEVPELRDPGPLIARIPSARDGRKTLRHADSLDQSVVRSRFPRSGPQICSNSCCGKGACDHSDERSRIPVNDHSDRVHQYLAYNAWGVILKRHSLGEGTEVCIRTSRSGHSRKGPPKFCKICFMWGSDYNFTNYNFTDIRTLNFSKKT